MAAFDAAVGLFRGIAERQILLLEEIPLASARRRALLATLLTHSSHGQNL
jgi:hypothetical protein